ncbi:flagellar motor switch protein FliG [Treponema sp. TIM-1]|uniref:flagellar motor switch protein FliG n=1 Tax=Treponema sp. TIM-1 TaxID=2898417 RepID=UPI00397EC2E1
MSKTVPPEVPGTGLLKTGLPGGLPPKKAAPPPEGDSKYRRVAKFLILIGGDEAAKILSQLEVDQVELISKEIASVRGITAEEAESILAEFRSILDSGYRFSGGVSGGVETARRLLYAAFGPVQGETYLTQAVPESKENPFGFLEDFSGEQLALLLREESPAASAVVLSRLSPQLSAALLTQLPGDQKAEILRRIAHLDKTAPEVLERVAAVLREKARAIGRGREETLRLDGMGALTAILKSSDLSFGDRLLQELEENDPGLGRNIKERLYTLEDVIRADNRPLQEKLRSMSNRDIVLLLKGRSGEFTEKIYANLSAGRQEMIREETELIGPVPKVEVDAAARDFLAWFRLNREEGRIILLDDEDVV